MQRGMNRYRKERQEENRANELEGNPGDVDFQRMIKKWRVKHAPTKRDLSSPDTLAQKVSVLPGPRVFVRKRPVNRKERKSRDYDVVSISKGEEAVVHSPKLLMDGITKVLSNQIFRFDGAFSAQAKNNTVFDIVALPLLRDIFSNGGGNAICFAFGQTGSGKTHTVDGIQDYLVGAVFSFLKDHPTLEARISYYEIYGKTTRDLLNKGKEVFVREDARKNVVEVQGVVYQAVHSPEEMRACLLAASKSRVTKTTENNARSSRSHSIAKIQFVRKNSASSRRPSLGKDLSSGDTTPARVAKPFGQFTLVDLAGSERHDDSRLHTGELLQESASINTSLLALKECIRAIGHNKKRVHFRGSKLTMVLKESLIDPALRISVIATVSPSASNSDHTVNTLKYATLLMGDRRSNSVTRSVMDVPSSLRDDKAVDSTPLEEEVQCQPTPPALPKMKPKKKKKTWRGLTLLKKKLKNLDCTPRTHFDNAEATMPARNIRISINTDSPDANTTFSKSLVRRQNSMRHKISDSPVLVIVRVRPFLPAEIRAHESSCLDVLTKSTLRIKPNEYKPITTPNRYSGYQSKSSRELSHIFNYDSILTHDATQERTYKLTGHLLVDKVLEGYNATIFAYGQTGAGKTHTMMGTQENPGIMLSMTQEILSRYQRQNEDQLGQAGIEASFIEIYEEKVFDLWKGPASAAKQYSPQILETPGGGIELQHTTRRAITSVENMKDYIWKGLSLRSRRSTRMNVSSSRSHAVLIMYVPTSNGIAKVNLCDLAGSERQEKTGATGQALREAVSINQSLSSLGSVVLALTSKKMNVHVPYRNSILTRILQDSLGGNAYTMIIANISAASSSYHETLSTLRFAARVKRIKNEPLQPVKAPPTLAMMMAKNKYLEAKLAEAERKLALQNSPPPPPTARPICCVNCGFMNVPAPASERKVSSDEGIGLFRRSMSGEDFDFGAS